MVVVETDFILALSSREDRHHDEVVSVLRKMKGRLVLSPYTLLELDLLVRSGRISVRLPAYYDSLARLLDYYGVRVAEPHPQHFAVAWRIRSRYELTYFDSLHAAVAIVLGDSLASYDGVYRAVKELRYIHPSKLA